MVKSSFGHMVINVNPAHMAFYKNLLIFMGWTLWHEEPGTLGLGTQNGSSLWFSAPLKADVSNDYDGVGMNHLCLEVASQGEVDEAAAYLQEHGVPALFETPRHRPDFSSGPENTYYQVMFESPDRILFEVVYIGPKQ